MFLAFENYFLLKDAANLFHRTHCVVHALSIAEVHPLLHGPQLGLVNIVYELLHRHLHPGLSRFSHDLSIWKKNISQQPSSPQGLLL